MYDTHQQQRRRAYPLRCADLATDVMREVFGKTPYAWQQKVIAHLCCMQIPQSSIAPAPVLLVRPTGGGKSAVRDVSSILSGGFSLTITPLLSLGADQEEKITLRAKDTGGTVVAVHFDEVRSVADQQSLITSLKLIPVDGHTTVIMFSSPQAILNKTFLWKQFIHWLIDNDLLSLVCVDEVHLFVHFGLTFRDEFRQLTTVLFNKLKVIGSLQRTKIPLLFMTGTCTRHIVQSIEKIVGIRFDTTANIFWPGPDEMQHRQVMFEVAYTSQPLAFFKKRVAPTLKATSLKKFIVYSNTRANVDRSLPKILEWIDLEGFKADVLKIVGTLHREQKFYHIRVFTKSNADNVDVFLAGIEDERPLCREDERPFNPQILVATSGAANAGLDDPEVHGVTRMEFPPSVLDVQQEKGRAGRRPHANEQTDWFLLCISLESYVVLLKRLHNNPSGNKDLTYFEQMKNDMHECLLAFVLPQHCYHSTIEMKMANPYCGINEVPVACLDACSYCLGKHKTMFPTIVKHGVSSVLFQLFVGPNQMKTRPVLDKDLVQGIRNFKGSNRLMFGTNSDKKPEPLLVKKLILMLLGAKILSYTAERTEPSPGKFTVTIYGSLAFVSGDTTRLAINDDTHWVLLPLKD
jgi:hypothetical protein